MNIKTNKSAAEQFAAFGLEEQAAGRRESASGPGSSLDSTAEVRGLLAKTIKEYGITSILDLGCGDWNWMRLVMESPVAQGVHYEGWDVHEGMIRSLQSQHGSEKVRFKVADIIGDPFPRVDLVVCRDVLFHIENELVEQVIKKVFLSQARYLLSTTFPSQKINEPLKRYMPIDGWGFRRINLDVEPFGLKKLAIRRVREKKCSHKRYKRFVCLYAIHPE